MLVGVQNGTDTLEDSLAISYKTECILPSNPTNLLLGIYPQDLKIYVYTKTCTHMFRAVLFTIAETWKQSRYPSNWYIPTMEYYSAVERKELLSHHKT